MTSLRSGLSSLPSPCLPGTVQEAPTIRQNVYWRDLLPKLPHIANLSAGTLILTDSGDNALGSQALFLGHLLRGTHCLSGFSHRPPILVFSLSTCHLFLLLWKEACHTTMKSFSTLAPLPASHFSLFKSVCTVSLATWGRSWYFFYISD